jgi:glycosyltransferase involved in cell wall biosynthesis
VKVLHVDTGGSWRGGQQQVFYLHRGLLQRGVASFLVCTARGELERRTAAVGLPVRGAALRGEWDLSAAWRIARLSRALEVTHVHLHTSHAQTLGLLAARVGGCGNTIVTRRVDFVPRRHMLNRWKYGGAVGRFVAISEAIRRILADFGIDPERIRTVHSGIDLGRTAPGAGVVVRRELGIAPTETLVGNVAHLADHKGQRYLVEAIPSVLSVHPQARFVIVGEGELEHDLKTRAASLSLGDRLVFAGFRADVAAVIDALDVFVMPSHLEGLGTVVLDALAARKPVVATAAGGIPEVIRDGHHGLLVPPKDPQALARGIVRLLDDPDLSQRLGKAGRGRVEKCFSVETMVQGNLSVYAELGGS